jgi:hypothetical protein
MLLGPSGPAGLAFAVGVVGAAIALSADPRYSRDLLGDVPPVPDRVRHASRLEIAVAGVFPSTVGVVVLTVIALFLDAALAALLSGILAGMAVSGFIAWINLDAIERRNDYRLYLERPGRRVFAEPR